MRLMKILSIETSCDETAIASVEASGGLRNPKFQILKNLVASQVKVHQPFGGVVPNLAKREHIRNLPILFKEVQGSSFIVHGCDLVAVTVGPGLEPCLWTGINFAKELRMYPNTANKPKIIGTSHLDGHLYSFLLPQKTVNPKLQTLNPKQKTLEFRVSNLVFPAISLLVSGGHTILILMKDLTHLKKLGETRDDAVGESFDKVARLLGLPYPGGPEIEKVAKQGNPEAINFPRPMLNQKNYDFSFSGLKTSVLYYLRDPKQRIHPNLQNNYSDHSDKFVGWDRIANVAASFQKAAFDVLIKKSLRAVKEFEAKTIIITGGVAANKTLGRMFKQALKEDKFKTNLIIPEPKFCTDNAAMIAVAGYINFLQNKNKRLIARGDLSI